MMDVHTHTHTHTHTDNNSCISTTKNRPEKYILGTQNGQNYGENCSLHLQTPYQGEKLWPRKALQSNPHFEQGDWLSLNLFTEVPTGNSVFFEAQGPVLESQPVVKARFSPQQSGTGDRSLVSEGKRYGESFSY